MKTHIIVLVTVILLHLAPSYVIAESVTSKLPLLEVTDAWTRCSMFPSNNSAAYMILQNNTDLPYEIVGATSIDTANDVRIQQSFVDDKGVSRVIEINKLLVPARSKIELKPSGAHILLMNLKHELLAGEKIMINLIIKGVGVQTVHVEVRGLE